MTTAVCVHHWRIEAPHGQPTLRGVCLHCRAVRDFPAAGVEEVEDRRKLAKRQSADMTEARRLAREEL